MLPSEALKKIFKIRCDLEQMPYNSNRNAELLEQAYKDFDDAIQSSLLDLIRQYDNEVYQSNKGDK